MEAAKAKTGSTVDAPPLALFTWTIENFSRLNTKKLYSDVFYFRGHKWRILIFPKGNDVDNLSMYLDVADSGALPKGWSRYAQFGLSVVNQIHSSSSIRKYSQHWFNARESDWGFTSFMPLGELYDPAAGYLLNDTCIIEADIDTLRIEEKEKEEEEEEEEEEEKEKTDMDTEKYVASPFAEFDAMFKEIQNLLKENTSGSNSSNKFCTKEISDAEKVFEECLGLDITSVIQSGKAPEFMKSLSILLSQKSFPTDTIERTTEISANFVQSCEQYETAQQNLSEARENEVSVSELKASLKQLLADFTPVRNQAEAIDQDLARLEKQLASRKAHKVILLKKLEDLTAQASTSKEALVCAEEKMKLSSMKKEQAEKVIEDVGQSWEFLKDLRRQRG